MWVDKSSGAVNVRKSDFIESINLRWKNRISARNGVYEIKKLQVVKQTKNMITKIVKFSLCSMIFFMHGCTSTLTPLSQSQPVSAERIYVKAMNTNSSSATLIFVKDEGTWASIGYHQVFIDGKLVASMKTGERLTIDVDPGDHILGILPVAFASTKDEFLGGYATTSLDQYVRAGISYHYRILVDGDNSSRIQRYVPTQGL